MNDEMTTLLDELKRHIEVTAESLKTDIRALGSGVSALEDNIEEFHSVVNGRFDELQAVLKAAAFTRP